MMLAVPVVATPTTMPATAIIALTANRLAAAARQSPSTAVGDDGARARRGCRRMAIVTITIATSAATGNATVGPPSRIAAMIGTAIAKGKANSIHGWTSAY